MDRDVATALEDYVRARGQRLLRSAYLLTGDPQLAQDLVQNALASALVSWRRLRDVADLDAYLYTAIVHARSRWWRRRWHQKVPTERLPDVPAPDEIARFDSRVDVLALLAELPTRQRQVVVLRYFDDLTEVQTAQVLGCSVGTVKSQNARALARMRAALGGDRAAAARGDDPGRGAA